MTGLGEGGEERGVLLLPVGWPDARLKFITCVASPSLAGIANAAGHFNSNANAELTIIYSNYTNPSFFRDITSGTNGYSCVAGWDYCTGVGSPLIYTDK